MRTFKLDIPEVEQIPEFVKILDDLTVGNNVFLVGAAGTGKTTLGEKVAYSFFGRAEDDKKALPYTVINCNQWTSPIDLIGGQTIEGYKEGRLIEAWQQGKVLILDEMPKLDANTAGILNDALAKTARKEALIFNGLGTAVPKHPDFGCIATGNVIGKGASGHYVGNNKQDASLLDRFSGSIYHIGFNEALERMLIYRALVEICLKIRNALLNYEGRDAGDDTTDDIMTLRTMINFQRSYQLEMLRETGIKDINGNTLPRNPKGKTLKDAIESYFYAMNKDKAIHIKEEVNIEGFYNSYKGREPKDEFKTDYYRKVA